MSWNPLRKRPVTKQQSLPLVTQIEQEDDYKKYLLNLQKLDNDSHKLYKEMKKCTEMFAELAKSEQKLTNNLASSQLCHYDERLREVTEEYFSISKAMDQNTNELILISQKAVLEPVKKYNNIFTHLNTALKKRDQLLMECQKCQTRLEKQQEKEKTGQNIAKSLQYKKQLTQAQEDLSQQTSQIFSDMPEFYNNRVAYFKPCFEAYVLGEIENFGRTSQLFNELAQSTQQTIPVKDESHIKKCLSEIKSLSIVAD